MTVTSAALGSRTLGGLQSLGGRKLLKAAPVQGSEADQNTWNVLCPRGRSCAGSCYAHICGAGAPLPCWLSHVLCQVLLKPISCPEGKLLSLLRMQVHFSTGLLHLLTPRPGTLFPQSMRGSPLLSFCLREAAPTSPPETSLFSHSPHPHFPCLIFSFSMHADIFLCLVIYGFISPRECQLCKGSQLFCSQLRPGMNECMSGLFIIVIHPESVPQLLCLHIKWIRLKQWLSNVKKKSLKHFL